VHKDLDALCSSLDALATAVRAGWTGDQTFCEAWGWNCPSITRHDLAAIADRLSLDIRNANPDLLPEREAKQVSDFPRRLQLLQTHTLPQLWGGNNGVAVSAYTATLSTLRETLAPVIGWQLMPDNKLMPAQLSRKLRSVQADLEQLLPNKEIIAKQLEEIRDAHEAAETLPIDMKALSDARKETTAAAAEAAASAAAAKKDAETAESSVMEMRSKHSEADKLVAQCEEAYRITTTKGLAAAFDQRATRLASSMWVWVIGLVVALAVGSMLGAERIHQLSQALGEKDPQWGVVWLNLLLSVISVGAPIWFAWIATKQVGQRFRLAEDYGYKASVAKAYEGYRKEAARIDVDFEHRLFNSALTRLEEAPLRLVERESHGSPWHEFATSPVFRKALDSMPDLREAFNRLVTRLNSQYDTPGSAHETTQKKSDA
jgi:hypothetical protein